MRKLLTIMLLLVCACAPKATPPKMPPFRVERDEIIMTPGAHFLKQLEITQSKPTPQGEMAFKTVGQIIALANSSVLAGSEVSWVELDSELTKATGLALSSLGRVPAGIAVGMTLMPAEYVAQIHPGQSVEISRYGLKRSDVQATIAKVEPRLHDHGTAYVTFQIRRGQDWYPGTNCEVRFPLLHVKTSEVPTTSVLHEGTHEYVLKQIAPLHFRISPVFIVDETTTTAQVMGIEPGDFVIGSGAILLKPELRKFIHEQKGVGSVLR